MSDVQSTPENPEVADGSTGQQKGTNPLRLIILLSVFGVALAGLLYDYCIARPGIKKADKMLQGLLDGSIKDPNQDGTVTDQEVQTLIGRAPSNPDFRKLPNGKIEVYSWRSGLPYRTYDLFVVYTGRKMPLLYSASANQEPGADQLPPMTSPVKPMTQEELDEFVPLTPMGGGFGASPSGGGKQGMKGRGGKGRGKKADQKASPPAEAKGKAGGPLAPPPAKKEDGAGKKEPATDSAAPKIEPSAGKTEVKKSDAEKVVPVKKDAAPEKKEAAPKKEAAGASKSKGDS